MFQINLKQYYNECQQLLSEINFVQLKICRWHDIEDKIISQIYKAKNSNVKTSFKYVILTEYKDFFEANLYNNIYFFERESFF